MHVLPANTPGQVAIKQKKPCSMELQGFTTVRVVPPWREAGGIVGTRRATNGIDVKRGRDQFLAGFLCEKQEGQKGKGKNSLDV